MSILNNLNKKSPNQTSSKFGSMLKVGAGIGVAGGLYGAGELSKNSDRLHNDFGHVGNIFHKIDENTSVASSVPMSYLGSKSYPLLKDNSSISTMKKIVRRK